jgi:hypothetical protein
VSLLQHIHSPVPPGYPVVFSDCRKYRYVLWRKWRAKHDPRFVAFIGLNPSTADETRDDPTIRRCIRFARDWGYEGMVMLNLFGYRSTDPAVLKEQEDPLGPENNRWLVFLARQASLIVVAWGANGALWNRGDEVYRLLKNDGLEVFALGQTSTGEPLHPLYVPANTPLQPYLRG